MHSSSLSVTLTIAALIGAACSDGTQEQSPGEVLARDSTLSSGLQQADTSAFAAPPDAESAMDPDSATPPAPAMSAAAPRQPMPPRPATIHREPRPERLAPAGNGATAILEIVPGATLPPPAARRVKGSPRSTPR